VRKPCPSLVILGLLTLPAVAGAQNWLSVDYRGFTWGTPGGSGNSPGDTLHFVGVVERAAPGWGFDVTVEEVTIHFFAISQGSVVMGDEVLAMANPVCLRISRPWLSMSTRHRGWVRSKPTCRR